MRFSKTSEYALRALILMARSPEQRFSVRELHETLHIPQKYLSRIMADLGHAALLDVRRGKQGGYALARDRAEISVLEIVTACEGDGAFSRCILGLSRCSDDEPCPLHDTLQAQRAGIRAAMADTSLEQLAQEGARRLRG